MLLWCPAAELDTGLLPGFGSWRMYRMEDDPAETTDLSLVNEFVETMSAPASKYVSWIFSKMPGWLTETRSRHPLTSRGWSRNLSPRNCSSVS